MIGVMIGGDDGMMMSIGGVMCMLISIINQYDDAE